MYTTAFVQDGSGRDGYIYNKAAKTASSGMFGARARGPGISVSRSQHRAKPPYSPDRENPFGRYVSNGSGRDSFIIGSNPDPPVSMLTSVTAYPEGLRQYAKPRPKPKGRHKVDILPGAPGASDRAALHAGQPLRPSYARRAVAGATDLSWLTMSTKAKLEAMHVQHDKMSALASPVSTDAAGFRFVGNIMETTDRVKKELYQRAACPETATPVPSKSRSPLPQTHSSALFQTRFMPLQNSGPAVVPKSTASPVLQSAVVAAARAQRSISPTGDAPGTKVTAALPASPHKLQAWVGKSASPITAPGASPSRGSPTKFRFSPLPGRDAVRSRGSNSPEPMWSPGFGMRGSSSASQLPSSRRRELKATARSRADADPVVVTSLPFRLQQLKQQQRNHAAAKRRAAREAAKKNKQSQRSGGLAKLLRSQGATQQGAERSQGRGASRRGSANARGITVDDLPSQALVG